MFAVGRMKSPVKVSVLDASFGLSARSSDTAPGTWMLICPSTSARSSKE